MSFRCEVGDVLWVREKWELDHWVSANECEIYYSDGSDRIIKFEAERVEKFYKYVEKRRFQSPLFMPREACRLFLRVEEVRRERLQDITEADAIAEGIIDGGCTECGEPEPCECDNPSPDRRDAFIWLWNSINAEPGTTWQDNPEVDVITFSVVEGKL
jgi:hypothetical protein